MSNRNTTRKTLIYDRLGRLKLPLGWLVVFASVFLAGTQAQSWIDNKERVALRAECDARIGRVVTARDKTDSDNGSVVTQVTRLVDKTLEMQGQTFALLQSRIEVAKKAQQTVNRIDRKNSAVLKRLDETRGEVTRAVEQSKPKQSTKNLNRQIDEANKQVQ
jgi:hypothetical protein